MKLSAIWTVIHKIFYKDKTDPYKIINIMPGSVYWKNKKGAYLGCSDMMADFLGMPKEEIIGKDDSFLEKKLNWPKGTADNLRKVDLMIMETKISRLNFEETPFTDYKGEIIRQISNKVPLIDTSGEVIGILGNSVDISNQKKMEAEMQLAKEEAETSLQAMRKAQNEEQKQRQAAEQLQTENSIHLVQLEAQERFTKAANQVAHDIRSPLASLLMIVKTCEEIPERERIALRAVSIRINDIANNLLHQYKLETPELSQETEAREPILLSATLLQLLTEKKFEYQDSLIVFDCQFEDSAQFAFIEIELSAFTRMISNVINNAIEAREGKDCAVILKLDATTEWVTVTVADNGKGMSPALIEKIMNNEVVTEGKIDGNGIGLTQVRETLRRNYGAMTIDSKVGSGTKIILKFPRTNMPTWMTDDISLWSDDIVVVLDDDRSIHVAWDTRFQDILKQAPNIKVHHFEDGQETLAFIGALTESEKRRTLLLTDFELLKQNLNGLDVIEKASIEHSILVTSHYANLKVQNRATQLGTKILPKQLASEVPIHIASNAVNADNKSIGNEATQLKQVDAIWVDDDEAFTKNLELFLFDEKNVDFFNDPNQFLKQVVHYPRDSRIYLDNNFKAAHKVNGLDLANQLHEWGYSCITIVSGDTFQPHELPSYVKVLSKAAIDHVMDDWE